MGENDKKKPVPTYKLRDAAVIGFGLTLAVLLVGGLLGYINAGRLAENSQWVAHTHEVIGELEALLSTLKDAETGQRGYLLTEDEKYLESYDDALQRVGAEVARLKELTSDNPDQQARLAVLDKKMGVRLDELKQTVALMKKGDRPAALKVVRSGTGKTHMDELRREIAIMQQAEHDLLRKRADESAISYHTTVLSILLPAIIGVVLVGVVFYLSQRNIRQRQRAAEVLAEQKERLRTTLASIGDAVISTDAEGNVTYMNAVSETLTGWKNDEASGVPLTQVFNIVNESTRQPVENPALRALKEGTIVGLANHTVLIAKDRTERPIDDSASPIRDADGKLVGVVLVFRDISERKQVEAALAERVRLLALSAEVGTALTQPETLRATLQLCKARQWSNTLTERSPAFGPSTQKKMYWSYKPAAGLYTHIDGPHGRVPVGKFKIGLIAQEQKPHLTNGVVGDPRVSEQEWARREGMVAFAGYPLVMEDRLVGVMAMFALAPAFTAHPRRNGSGGERSRLGHRT